MGFLSRWRNVANDSADRVQDYRYRVQVLYSRQWKYSMAQLRSVTCHTGSPSVTYYPTQVNTPRLNPSRAGRYSIYLPLRDGRLSWPSWLDSRGVREWLSVFPIPPIPTWSFPFPFPKFMHCETYSHSHTIPESSFPFPPIPIPAKWLTNRNISKETMCVMSFAFTDWVTETRRTEYKYTDISDYSKHKRVNRRRRLHSPTFSLQLLCLSKSVCEQRLLAQTSNKVRSTLI